VRYVWGTGGKVKKKQERGPLHFHHRGKGRAGKEQFPTREGKGKKKKSKRVGTGFGTCCTGLTAGGSQKETKPFKKDQKVCGKKKGKGKTVLGERLGPCNKTKK